MRNSAARVPDFHFWACHFTSLSPLPMFKMKEHGFTVPQSVVFQTLASESLGMLVKNQRFPRAEPTAEH